MDERGSIIANSFAGSAQEIAEAIEGYASERRGVIVGVDAPLAVPNERGTRKIERILSKVALPAYSASRRMFGDEPRAEELLAELERVGVEYTDYPFPRERGQWVVVEVDSAATLKILSLEREGGKGGDLAQRLRRMEEPRFRKGNKEGRAARSEEHTSELQSRQYLVCRLLLAKKNTTPRTRFLRSPSIDGSRPLTSSSAPMTSGCPARAPRPSLLPRFRPPSSRAYRW